MNDLITSSSDSVQSSAQPRQRSKHRFGRLRSFRLRLGGDSGTSLIEFTFSVPVLFMLLIGFIQTSFAIYSNLCVTALTRDTARWASVRGSNSCADAPAMTDCNATAAAIQATARRMVYPGIDSSKITVSTTWLQASSVDPVTWTACTGSSKICNAPGNAVQVALTYPLPFEVPFVSAQTLSLHSTSQLVIVQ